jgi:hypothetical protein
MALTPSTMAPLGTPAPDFRLPDIDGLLVSLADCCQAPGFFGGSDATAPLAVPQTVASPETIRRLGQVPRWSDHHFGAVRSY